MSKLGRCLFGALFALSLAVCGLALGIWLGATYFVPPGQGLAGPLEALGYGVLGALAGVLIGIVLAYLVAGRLLKIMTGVAGVPAIAILAFVTLGALASRAELQGYLDEEIANLPPISLRLSHSDALAARPFASIEYDTARGQYAATLADGSVCTGRLPAQSRDKVELLTALRNVEILVAQQPSLCAGGGAVVHELDFRIREATAGITEGRVTMTEMCLAEQVALRELVDTASEVYRSHRGAQTCS